MGYYTRLKALFAPYIFFSQYFKLIFILVNTLVKNM